MSKSTKSETEPSSGIDAALVLDRFISASSSDDVSSSLSTILRGLQKTEIAPTEIYTELQVLAAFVQVLQTSKYKDLPADDAVPTIARIYLELFNQCSANSKYKDGITTMLQEPSEGRLLETIIDVAAVSDADDDNNNVVSSGSIYGRVVCIQLLHAICKARPKTAQQQLMNAPNGLHRLGDLLKPNTPEQVRNEALLLSSTIAEWPAAAKVWMFNEVGDLVIQTAIKEGGLTGGNVLVLDCLKLLQNMLKHDAALADLVFQSPVVPSNLARLLDLRGGQNFRFPKPASTASTTKIPKSEPVDDDDLDALIASGSKKSNTKDTGAAKESREPEIVVPHLTEAEEKVINAVFDILATVLENESVKVMVWKKHAPIASLIWELALISPPPPGKPFPCAAPSINLQQRALQITALYFSDPTIMDRHAGLDRLLYIVCTGGRGTMLREKMQLQQSAIHVIRKTLTIEMSNQMLLNVLAPPTEDADPGSNGKRSANASVVKKLLNTTFENLLMDNENNTITAKPPSVSRKVFLSGGLRGLELFLNDEASRSILFRITQENAVTYTSTNSTKNIPSLVDAILDCLMYQSERSGDDDFIVVHLLRFLLSWIYETPIVVQAILSSSHSSILSILFTKSNTSTVVTALTNCILGLCMEFMGDETKCGGWTRASIMEMIISKKGVGRFTSQIEKLKSTEQEWWSLCSLERNVWRGWYDSIVLIVRKRVVQEITSTGGEDEETDDESNPVASEVSTAPTPKSQKSLQRLLSQQSNEIDELREQLTQARHLNLSQEKQIAAWKQRAESMPNQLDELIDELTTKNAALDQRVMSLEEEIRVTNDKKIAELKLRDERIDSLVRDLEETKKEQDEMREENNSLRDEMTGLNQAYASLESEYHRQQAEMATLVPQPLPSGENTEHGLNEQTLQPSAGSTEVSMLRAENSRLQAQLKEADDWIAMAVPRMSELEAHITGLNESIQNLQTEHGHVSAELDSARQALQQEINNISHLENINHQLLQAQHNNNDLRQKLEESVEIRQSLEQQLSAASAERDTLESRLQELMTRAESTSTENQQSSSSANEVDDSVQKTLQKEIETLRMQLNSKQQEYENALTQKEQIVAQLEESLQKVSSGASSLESYPPDMAIEVERRDQEIAALRQLNEDAQNWIDDAMQRHQMYVETLNKLTEENNYLKFQLEQANPSASLISHFTGESADNDEKLKLLESQIASLQSELQVAQGKIESQRDVDDSLRDLRNEIDRLKAEIDTRDDRMTKLNTELSSLDLSTSERPQTKQQTTLESTKIASNQALLETIRNLESQLIDQEEEHNTVINEWEETYSKLESEMTSVEASLKEVTYERDKLKTQLEENSNQVTHLTNELRTTRDALEQASIELKELSVVVSDREKDVKDVGAADRILELEATIQDLTEQLQDQETQALEVVQMWQQSYSELEVKLTALVQSEAPEIEVAKENLIESDTAQLKQTIEDLRRELEVSGADAEEVVAAWQNSYNQLELQYAEISQEKEQCLSALLKLQNELERIRQSNLISSNTNESAEHSFEQSQEDINLKVVVKSLDSELSNVVQEAEEAVQMWQRRCNELEARLEFFESNSTSRITAVKQEIVDQNELLASDSNLHTVTINNDEQIAKLQELETAVQYWQSKCNSLEGELNQYVQQKTEFVGLLKLVLDRLYGATYSELFTSSCSSESENREEVPQISLEANPVITANITEMYALIQARSAAVESQINIVLQDRTMLSNNLKDVKSKLSSMETKIEESNLIESELVANLKKTLHDLQEQATKDKQQIQELQSNHQIAVFELKNRVTNLIEENEEIFTSFKESQENMDAYRAYAENQQKNLEASVQNYEDRIRENETAHLKLIEEWQVSYNALKSQFDLVVSEKEDLSNQLERTLTKPAIAPAVEEEKTETIDNSNELTNKIKTLEEQLVDVTQDAEEAIEMWRITCSELEREVEGLLEEKRFWGESKQNDNVNDSNEQLKSQIVLLENLRQNETEQFNSVITDWKRKYTELESRISSEKQSRDSLLSSVQGNLKQVIIDTMQGTDDGVSEVDFSNNDYDVLALLQILKARFHSLTEKVNDTTKRNDSLLTELNTTNSALADANHLIGTLQANESDFRSKADRISELEAIIQSLQQALRDSFSQTTVVQNSVLVEGQTANQKKDTTTGDTIDSQRSPGTPESSTEDFRAYIKDLEEQIVDQRNQAEFAVGEWQNSYETLMSEFENLAAIKEDLQSELDQLTSGKQVTDALQENKIAPGKEIESERDVPIHGQLDEYREQLAQSTAVNETLKAKIKVLESRVSSHMETAFHLQGEFDRVNREKAEIESRLKQSIAQIRELECAVQEWERNKNGRVDAENRSILLEKKLAESENLLISRLEQVTAEKERQIELLRNAQMHSCESVKTLESDLSVALSDKLHLKQENERLESQVTDLANELRAANSTMQVFVTNALNEKAAQVAAEALRVQVEDLANQLEQCKESLATERATRIRLEKETEALSADISALVGIQYNDENKPEIQNKVFAATEVMHQRERRELDELKQALSRSVEDLKFARSSQQKLEDSLAKARHEAVVYEQQVVVSKNEFLYLSRSMDEMREAESSRRASYEYRIGSLENEVKMQRLRYSSEIETLKNELNQISIEKESFLQSLKESEKRRETLLSTISLSSTDTEFSERALRRVQLEKSHLLSIASEEASSLERRLRETRAAQKASLEAEIILERELRLKAESELASVRKEFEEGAVLKIESSDKASIHNSTELTEQLQKELEQLSEKLNVRNKENADLRIRLESTMRESHASIVRLQLEVQNTRARVMHFERAGHYEAEVRAEQERLRASFGDRSPERIVMERNNPADEEKKDDVVVSRLYDFIKKQTEAIEEERSVYTELAKRNEELLALLAQLGLLRNALKGALIEHAGQPVFDETIRLAEEKARMEFGRSIKFS